jgi:hypothetical protein
MTILEENWKERQNFNSHIKVLWFKEEALSLHFDISPTPTIETMEIILEKKDVIRWSSA